MARRTKPKTPKTQRERLDEVIADVDFAFSEISSDLFVYDGLAALTKKLDALLDECGNRPPLGRSDGSVEAKPFLKAARIQAAIGILRGALDGFRLEDHQRLRDFALRLKRKGVHVILTNADVPIVRELYKGWFSIRRVEARRNINSKAGGRGPVGEVIIT